MATALLFGPLQANMAMLFFSHRRGTLNVEYPPKDQQYGLTLRKILGIIFSSREMELSLSLKTSISLPQICVRRLVTRFCRYQTKIWIGKGPSLSTSPIFRFW
jgi:hypothetical protein